MGTYIALLRGINVGGNNMLKMADLVRLMEANGCADVRTYIQSGNVVFRSAASDPERLAKRIGGAIAKLRGFEPRVLVLTAAELERAAAANPFPEADRQPKHVHLFFLEAKPAKPDLKAIEELRAKSERFVLKGSVFYMHTPDGLGRSKLATRAERLLGVAATARNWNTVATLLDMAREKPRS
jgi:uncharacterized protein (DUF1697 family)